MRGQIAYPQRTHNMLNTLETGGCGAAVAELTEKMLLFCQYKSTHQNTTICCMHAKRVWIWCIFCLSCGLSFCYGNDAGGLGASV
jgi:hypothetical protein